MRPPRMYQNLWQRIKAQVNKPVVLYVPKDKQYTVRRMIGKERWKDKTIEQRDAYILVYSNFTSTSMTVTWRQYSGATLAPLVDSGKPLFIDVQKELENGDVNTD